MEELRFESSLGMDKIEDNFKSTDILSGIQAGLQEALAYERGSADKETVVRKRDTKKRK